jgi:hypothetical protein
MSSEAKRTWGWVGVVVGIATIATLALGWRSDAMASGAVQATTDLRLKMLEKGAEVTRDEIREIRQDVTAIRRSQDKMCAAIEGCRE